MFHLVLFLVLRVIGRFFLSFKLALHLYLCIAISLCLSFLLDIIFLKLLHQLHDNIDLIDHLVVDCGRTHILLHRLESGEFEDQLRQLPQGLN